MLLWAVVPMFFRVIDTVSWAVKPQPETGELMLVTPTSIGSAEGTVRTEIPITFRTPAAAVLLKATLCTVLPALAADKVRMYWYRRGFVAEFSMELVARLTRLIP